MLRKTGGQFRRTAVRLIGLGGLSLAAFCLVAALLGVRINTSYSLPMGLYIATNDPAASLVEFCPIGLFAQQSSERGYRTPGFACMDGAVPA